MRLSKKTQAAVRAGAGVTMKQLNHVVPKRQKRQSLTSVDHWIIDSFHIFWIFFPYQLLFSKVSTWATLLLPPGCFHCWRHKIGSTPEVMCWEPVHPNRITQVGGGLFFWHFILLNRSRVPQAQMYEEAWTAYSKQKFSEVWTVWTVWIGRVSQKTGSMFFYHSN